MAARGYGIVPYELAFSETRARSILEAWSVEGRTAARRSLLIDFGFIPSYALFFSSLAVLCVRRLPVLPKARWVLPLFPLGAGACDAAENLLLLRMLGVSGPTDAVATAAGAFASVKFCLLAVSLLLSVAAGLAGIVSQRRGATGGS